MKIIKQIICWWRGHYPDPSGHEYGCQRCGQEYLSYAECVEGGVWYKLKSWWTYEVKPRLGRDICPDCGKPYKKGIDHNDCCPF